MEERVMPKKPKRDINTQIVSAKSKERQQKRVSKLVANALKERERAALAVAAEKKRVAAAGAKEAKRIAKAKAKEAYSRRQSKRSQTHRKGTS
ncbi:hypothetical protein ON010_g18518 [Phytophthora cinnamomi]|nr:hypothetical protein ON010_g18518 [Phytophthora cinnamomi]